MEENNKLLRDMGLNSKDIFKIENEPEDYARVSIIAEQIKAIAECVRRTYPNLKNYATGLELLAINLQREVNYPLINDVGLSLNSGEKSQS